MGIRHSPNLRAILARPDQPISDAFKILSATEQGIVLVVEADHRLVGTVTDGDMRRAVLERLDFSLPISTLLAKKKGTRFENPITALPGQSPEAYLKILKKNEVLHLPVVDAEGRVLDLLCLDDLMPDRDLSVQAVLMAGGQGKRLMPLTEKTPKPMLPVGNQPLMEIIIRNLRKSGIRKVKITTHHKSEEIVSHFEDGKKFDIEVSYLDEKEPLGTAGALGLLEKTKETLLVMNGDILTDMDFRSMIAFHKEHEADCTVAVRKYDVKVPYGVINCEEEVITDVIEKPVYNLFVNAGIYLIEPSVLGPMRKKAEYCDMPDLIKRFIAQKKTVISFPIMEEWIDIGHHQSYEEAQKLVESWSSKL